MTLRLQLLDKGFQVAPVAIVTSWSSTTKAATLSTTDATGGASPGSFQAGWGVRMFDVSSTPHVSNTLQIQAVTATAIQFFTAPSFTPAAGDLIMPLASNAGGAASSGYTPRDFIYQVPDAGTLGIAGFEDPRWS